MDTPAGEPAAFGGVFAEFSPRHIRSKIVQDKARYRFDRRASTKSRNAGLFKARRMLSVPRICRISAIYMPSNAAVPTILPLFMRRGYQYGRKQEELSEITLLGNQGTTYTYSYDPEILEVFNNKHPKNDYFVKFNCPEFTSLCPITGQPDFATIYISYIPGEKMVESKSLKLYLFSFRNHGDFHEDCMNIIMEDLIKLMDPKYIEVWGKFTPRGGISIDPYCNYGRPGTKFEEMAQYRLMNHDLYPEKVDNR